MSRRALPHHLEAEASVIGGVLLQPRVFAEVSGLVEARDFFHPAHAAIYEAIVELDGKQMPIDALTVAEQMRGASSFGLLRAFNGEAYFGELVSVVVTVENIAHYARVVALKAARRRVIEASNDVAAEGYGDGDDEEFLEEAERKLLAATLEAQPRHSGPVHVKRGLLRLEDAVAARRSATGGVIGVPSGFGRLDELTAGFRESTLNIIAARPKHGKTALAGCVGLTASLAWRIPTLIFSLEMAGVREEGGGELLERLVSVQARIDGGRMRKGQLVGPEWIRMQEAASVIYDAPLWIDDEPAQTLAQVRSKARRWRATEAAAEKHPQANGKALVIVDYLQLMRSPQKGNSGSNREREVAEVAEGLKALAKELRLPVLALAQLNRGVEMRSDKRPMMSDLRESGAIEQAADLIAFIYREAVYSPEADPSKAELIVSAQRSGPTGVVAMRWRPECTRFEPADADAFAGSEESA